MIRIIYLLLFSFSFNYAQINIYHSQENIRLFADYLFCQNDFLRAIEEYDRLDATLFNDTILFKVGYSYLQINNYEMSNKYFDLIEDISSLKSLAVSYKSLNYFLRGDINSLKSNIELNSHLNITNSKKLLLFSYILDGKILQMDYDYRIFNNSDRLFVNELIQKKINPDYKSPTVAGILSVIPGLGKIYTKNYYDGLTSLLLTGLFTFLAYDNFYNSHLFRGYLFSFTAIGFYLGNIYGSIISAFRYNKKYDEKVIYEVNKFLMEKNYFIEKVDFFE